MALPLPAEVYDYSTTPEEPTSAQRSEIWRGKKVKLDTLQTIHHEPPLRFRNLVPETRARTLCRVFCLNRLPMLFLDCLAEFGYAKVAL